MAGSENPSAAFQRRVMTRSVAAAAAAGLLGGAIGGMAAGGRTPAPAGPPTPAATPALVKAQTFVLEDDAGSTRAIWQVQAGIPSVTLFGPGDASAISLMAGRRPFLLVKDADGRQRSVSAAE